ncbi:MAG: DUF4832 domain-containing protein [Lachnospiraceae bacterium]|nr:DUF4832 domain-containing protein [Lachnospiraceae bacterium]
MSKKRVSKVILSLAAFMVVAAAAAAAVAFLVISYRCQLNQTEAFAESDELIANPLIGFAPTAADTKACEDTQLVYIGLTWARWEPTEGVYDIQYLEETYHIEQWQEEGKHAVLRFLCDVPGSSGHVMDIPEWLYLQTMDGSFYTTSYGSGYSPNYENSTFRAAHRAAIEALADYCNESDFVAYVEIGSLGHWGEWHVHSDVEGAGMPDAEICLEYVLDYYDSFTNARLLMRRNYEMAAELGLGLYNDMTGSETSTRGWLSWIENGGSQQTDGKALEYRALENFWETAPVGGEFTSATPMEEMLGENLDMTLSLIEETHMSFIGPYCPTGEEAQSEGAQEVLKRLGYRLYISGLTTSYSLRENELQISMTWENTGIAPMYWDWPVTMYVYSLDGKLEYSETVEMNLTQLVPGAQIVTENSIPYSEQLQSGFVIGVSITDPEGEETLRLAMDAEEMGLVQVIYVYEGE